MNNEAFRYMDRMKISDPHELAKRVGEIRHVALDMDGTIYKGNTSFPFTVPFLQSLRKWGISYSFLTNNPSKSKTDYLAHLSRMRIPAEADEIYTSAQATIDYLQYNYPAMKRLFMLGTPSMIEEFEKAGYLSTADHAGDKPDAVVVAFDMSLNYERLCRAAWWIQEGLPYIATNPDKVCPTDRPVVLVDCGAICSCLETATGRKPDVVIGKPDPRMLEGILKRYALKPSEVAMVGDRIYTDIRMARLAGALGVLVLTGEATLDDIRPDETPPDLILDNLAMFGHLLAAYHVPIEIST